MRLNAYVMLGDPAFVGPSIRAYYPFVDRIVVSYDEEHLSWTRTPLPVDTCLDAVRALDVDGKCDFRPGRFAREGFDPLENDTFQRNAALADASRGADWVLQLDTDEVIPRPDIFLETLRHADDAGAGGLEFPARWLYTRVKPGLFLESSRRLWRPAMSYPGPVAVRAGSTLTLARQADVPLHRVDVRPWNTDPAHPSDAVVHEVVALSSAVNHYSWVRSDDFIRRKVGWSGHAAELAEGGDYLKWRSATEHPLRTVLTSPFRTGGRRFRFGRAADFMGEGR